MIWIVLKLACILIIEEKVILILFSFEIWILLFLVLNINTTTKFIKKKQKKGIQLTDMLLIIQISERK